LRPKSECPDPSSVQLAINSVVTSSLGPSAAASDTAAVTTLMLLHLVVGLVLMIGMRHSTDGTAS